MKVYFRVENGNRKMSSVFTGVDKWEGVKNPTTMYRVRERILRSPISSDLFVFRLSRSID